MNSNKGVNWQVTFKNLPEIPNSKRWTSDFSTTLEQVIIKKIINKSFINEEETFILLELINFYNELYERLESLDYESFNNEDLKNFKYYIYYAFSYVALMTSKYTIFKTYRMVLNENIIGKNERIKHIKNLKHPSLDVVKKINKYNRSNTPESSIFYSCEDIDTALKELKPPKNKLVTIGVWMPKKNRTFETYVVFYSDSTSKVNPDAYNAFSAFEKDFSKYPPIFKEFMASYYKLLGREYSKTVNHHYEYLISSLFSERIIEGASNFNVNYDCIMYPSVQNNYITRNFAIKSSIVDSDFYLER
ncbi:MAG: hypothetical protein IPH32_01285 [Bacteroidetes bacterium]|nr:hypothetical protein [Bacteroidota bacterium]